MAPTHIQVPTKVVDGTLMYIGVTSAFAKKAGDELNARRQAVKKAADQVPALVAHMVAQGVINKGQEKQAGDLLADHATTLGLLKDAVDKIAAYKKAEAVKQAGDLGKGEGEDLGATKVAGDYDSLSDPRVGLRTGNVKASDLPFLRLIGQA